MRCGVPDTEAEESRSLSDDHQAGVMGITHARMVMMMLPLMVMVMVMAVVMVMVIMVTLLMFTLTCSAGARTQTPTRSRRRKSESGAGNVLVARGKTTVETALLAGTRKATCFPREFFFCHNGYI